MKYESLSQFAMSDPGGFAAWCDTLREAGVMKLGALVLGPKPHASTATKEEADPYAVARRRHDVMFAASRIKPPFVTPPADDKGMPRILVHRQARAEAANGTSKPQR